MKSDTKNYVHLQKLYKAQAEAEKAEIAKLLENNPKSQGAVIPNGMLDDFVRNAHGLRVLRGSRMGTLDLNPTKLGM